MWYVHTGLKKCRAISDFSNLYNYTASSTFAQLSQVCPPGASGACYSVNVPDATAAGSQTDIYIKIEGPSTGWIGLGQGGQMRNANIFIIYPDASGTNVTLSARLGVGQIEPKYNSNAQVTLLEGSGISNGKMTANFRCMLFFLTSTTFSGRAIANKTRESIVGSSCANWGTGTMDLTASSTSWIWALKGTSAKSNSLSESLSRHDNSGNLNFNLQFAKGGNSLNPFVASAQATGTGTSSVSSPTADAASGNIGGSTDDLGFDQGLVTRARIAHGTIMGLAFVLFFPIGGIIIRVLSFRGLIWVHAGLQLLTYTLALAGMGLGVYIALKPDNNVRRILSDSFYSPVLRAYIFFCINLT